MSSEDSTPKRGRGRPRKQSNRQALAETRVPAEPLERLVIPRLALPSQEGKGASDMLSDALVAWISDQLRTRRVPLKFIAGAVGITSKTIARWLKQGEEDVENGILSRAAVLFIEVQRAQFEFVDAEMQAMRNAPPKEWVKHAWVLERCFQDTFAIKKEQKDPNTPLEALGQLFLQRINAQQPAIPDEPLIIDVPAQPVDDPTADSSVGRAGD